MPGVRCAEVPPDDPAREQYFLDRVAPLGLDWRTTRAEFRNSYGVTSYYGWKDVVPLPDSAVLTDVPLKYYFYWEDHSSDLPPDYLFADYMPEESLRQNFSRAERALAGRLGLGERKDTSNCLTRRWQFGVFSVELLGWPPELQRPMKNSLYEANPVLHRRASIIIRSDLPLVYPDDSLLVLSGEQPQPDGLKTLRHGRPMNPRPAGRFGRRNPAELSAVLPPNETLVWCDGPRIGFSAKHGSIVVQRTPGTALVLNRIQAARGSGGSDLSICWKEPDDMRAAPFVRTVVFSDGAIDGLDAESERLAGFLEIPRFEEQSIDD